MPDGTWRSTATSPPLNAILLSHVGLPFSLNGSAAFYKIIRHQKECRTGNALTKPNAKSLVSSRRTGMACKSMRLAGVGKNELGGLSLYISRQPSVQVVGARVRSESFQSGGVKPL